MCVYIYIYIYMGFPHLSPRLRPLPGDPAAPAPS